ncbi:hypothetical protein PYCCODRAFT_1360769 [Trametes coccinea BRFM310]|uniref:HTH APSES-type domain-containing protein n=1 Tax=Trametes coccinea (strain BRFM310) TaxID=1353009 RepID=A0A1Y2J121_TRAC3|nr:hypothetical protein PYCCODRAFT_1360769 [Trametes coccinea BRFM310]
MAPANKHFAVPKPGVARPPLPTQHANPHIRHLDASKPPTVKFQEIMRDGQSTVVGRVKIPTPNGHAFILRRLDTGAISQTTMFRAAFPMASEEAEKAETSWVKTAFDTSGANKSGKARFAGTWVTPDVALYLAESYELSSIIPALAAAVPDPNTTFRRARNAQQPTPTASPAAEPGPAPAKRRREGSPAPPRLVNTHTSPVKEPAVVPPSPPPSRVATSPAPRRSARLKSPGVSASPVQPLAAPKTPRTRKAARETVATPGGSDETAVDEDTEAAKIAEPDMQEDIREQRELIAKLKADREAKAQKQQQEEEDSEPSPSQHEAEQALTEDSSSAKRPREEEPQELRFNFKEPGQPEEVGERAIATNSRIRLLSQLPPERKSLAWGALAFAAGLGAITFLPNLQGMLF